MNLIMDINTKDKTIKLHEKLSTYYPEFFRDLQKWIYNKIKEGWKITYVIYDNNIKLINPINYKPTKT